MNGCAAVGAALGATPPAVRVPGRHRRPADAHRPGRPGAWARWALWRCVLAVTGGLRVRGRLPDTPCVLVANHSSHADTAALLAAVPARRRPVVAAAADYWFGGGRCRRLVGRWLAAAFPVRRHGGGSADLTAAAELLARGHDVVVYAEGTRSRDGSVGHFHSGAARLAARAGVPLVPVGIRGSRALWPAHGRLHRSRVEVRFGAPAGDITAARDAVVALAGGDGGREPRGADGPDSELRRWVARLAAGRTGGWVLFFWGFAEALCWPVLPEFALAVVVVAAPRQAVRLAGLAAAGSLAGGLVMYLLAAHGLAPPAPLTTRRMHDTAAAQVAAEGAHAVTHQPLSGIPYKVYGAAAGRAHAGLVAFLGWSVPTRALRILAAGLLAGAVGGLARRLRRWYPLYLTCFVTLFGAALGAVVTGWS